MKTTPMQRAAQWGSVKTSSELQRMNTLRNSVRSGGMLHRAVPAVVLTVAALLFASGCSIPIPQASADPTRFYVLSTRSAPAAAATVGGPALHVREVELPSYLRAQSIVVRRGDNEIEFREFARWGENLEQGIGRVLREELLARGAAGAVFAQGAHSSNSSEDRELKVRVLAFEGAADGSVNFHAVWDLTTRGAKPEPVAHGNFRPELKWDPSNEATLVARLSDALAALVTEISAALAKK